MKDDDVWTFQARLDSAHANVPLGTTWTLLNKWDALEPITVNFYSSRHYDERRRPRKPNSSLSRILAAHEPAPRRGELPPPYESHSQPSDVSADRQGIDPAFRHPPSDIVPSHRGSETRRSSDHTAINVEEPRVPPPLAAFQTTTSGDARPQDAAAQRLEALKARTRINEERARHGLSPLWDPEEEEDEARYKAERAEQSRHVPPPYAQVMDPKRTTVQAPVDEAADEAFVRALEQEEGFHLLQERIKRFLKAQAGGAPQTFREVDAGGEDIRFSRLRVDPSAEVPRPNPEKGGQHIRTRENVVSIICYLQGIWRAVPVTQEELLGLNLPLKRGARRYAFVLPGEELNPAPASPHVQTDVLVHGVTDPQGKRLYRIGRSPKDEWHFSSRSGFALPTDSNDPVTDSQAIQTTWTLWIAAKKGAKYPVLVHFLRRDPHLPGSREERRQLVLNSFEMGKGARGTTSGHARREERSAF